jgi:hypothetical protein
MKRRGVASNDPPIERAALVGLVTRRTRSADPELQLEELAGLASAAFGGALHAATKAAPMHALNEIAFILITCAPYIAVRRDHAQLTGTISYMGAAELKFISRNSMA